MRLDQNAHDHRIKGNQYCLVVFSLANNKSLLVISQHISCIRFFIKLTEMMIDQNTKLNDLKYVSISHVGKCCRNIKISPSRTEEHACIESVSLLLMDEEGNILNNDEVIFAKEIMSDGDTRGRNKFINSQLEILGSRANSKASLIPDIHHFIKCASNRFCTFKEKKSVL